MPKACLFPAALAAVCAFTGLTSIARAELTPIRFIGELAQGHRQKIVVYGTSLTANSEWPALLGSRLTGYYGKKAQITNAALGGKDSRWGLANLKKRVLNEEPDAVFIEFAVNDAVARSKLSTSEARWDLEQMILAVRQKNPNCQVILMVMNPPTGEALAKRPNYARYAQVYRQVAQASGCPLVDCSNRWKKILSKRPALWREYVPDGLHPNAQAAAQVILPQMMRRFGLAEEPATRATNS